MSFVNVSGAHARSPDTSVDDGTYSFIYLLKLLFTHKIVLCLLEYEDDAMMNKYPLHNHMRGEYSMGDDVYTAAVHNILHSINMNLTQSNMLAHISQHNIP